MSFHLGKPILVMIIIAMITGAAVALRPRYRQADLTMWIFAQSHYKSFEPLIPSFQKENNVRLNLELLSFQAEQMRLRSLFMSDVRNPQIPDIAEVEISQVGMFFRAPAKDMGFMPLNDILRQTGWLDKILPQRLASFTKDGLIFGVPHDVHPVTITYRYDLFKEAGVDLESAKTWAEFHTQCEKFERYWQQQRGMRYRHAIELPVADSGYIIAMLLQRGINVIDNENRIHIDDPKVANTMAFYAQLVAGPRRVAAQASGGTGSFTKDIIDGNLCAMITPDWRVGYIKIWAPELKGKLRMMPLPIFEPGDIPTSTWGGTMIGITKAAKQPEVCWKLIEKFYFSKEGLVARRRETDILPPVITLWDDPVYHEPDPFFGGQRGQELFIKLGRQIPRRYVTPATPLASAELTAVLTHAVSYLNDHGPEGLEAQCQKWLTQSARDLDLRIKQWSFE
jgi:arabinosaccharide transport system substrate-binding protein